MIIVKNRELLIPNHERYIGTTYDNESEMRLFQIPRFSQNGVDLSALTFRLDLKYANDAADTVILTKEVTDLFIYATWEINNSQLQVPGTVYIGIRAADDEVTVKWTSFAAAIYVDRHLNTPGNYTGDLTEIEQMEQDHQYFKSVVDELRSNLDYRQDAEAYAAGTRLGEDVPETDAAYHNNSKYYKEVSDQNRQTAEAYAKGTVDGVAVESGDTGYHDNSKYYSELAAASEQTATDTADAIVASRNQISTNATNIAAQTARIDNIVALAQGSTTGDAELQDIRVAYDGTTYTSAGTSVRAQIGDLKSALSDLEYTIYDERNIEIIDLSKGVFEGNGYGALSSTVWVHTEKLDAGKYTITPPTDWRFEIYAYNSDASGTLISAAYTGSTREFTITSPFIMSGRKNDNTAYTTEELEVAREGFSIIKHSENDDNLIAHIAKGDAELQDIRVAYDGTTYTSAGTSVRAQIGDLKNRINGLESVLINELNLTPIFSKGVFIDNGYGATSSDKWVHTQVLPAGNYVITPPPNWVFEIYAYVSDTQGTAIYTLSGMQREFSTMLPIVLSGRKTDNSAYTSSELETAKEEFIITVSDNPSSLQHITNSLTGIFRHSLEDANTRLTISLLQDYPSSENTGIRTYIFSVYSPTRIHVSDNSLLVRINRYSTFLSFNQNYVETLRRYALGCDYIVTSDSYPVYVAVGIRKNDLSEMTSADVETITEKLTIKAIDELNYTDISMFQTFAVAGDSWTAGTIYNIAHTAQITRTGQGWAENLARQSGIECTNYAVGGTSVRTWYNFNDGVNICGMKGLLESNAQGLYILSLGGSNDWQAGTGGARGWEIGADDPTDTTTYYMGSITDISSYNDYNDYPLTFYGYYGRIVEQIQEHAPNSRIIITSPNTYPTHSERCTACYSAVEEIAEYYGLPYMDLWKSPYYSVWKNTNLLNGLHPVASTYAGMAKAIGRLFSDVVKDNWEYFREYNGDLTTIPVTWSELVKS